MKRFHAHETTIKLLLVCLLLVGSFFASARQTDSLRFVQLGIENGLPDAKVTGIAQDAAGYIWIGTANGLSRYDGTEFRNFFHSNKTNSLAGNNITGLLPYDANHLIIATTTGLSLLDTRTLQFKNFVVNSSALLFSRDNSFGALAIDSKKNIWAGSRTTLYCLSPGLQVIKAFKGYDEQDYNKSRMLYVYDICTLSGNEMLFRLEDRVTWSGVYYILNDKADTLQPLQKLVHHPLYSLCHTASSFLHNDEKGNMHFLNSKGDSICYYDVNTRQLHYTRLQFTNSIPLKGDNNTHIHVLNAGSNALICTLYESGGFVLLPAAYPNAKLTRMLLPVYFKGEAIYAAKQDRDGNLWIGGENGLYTSVTRSANIQSNRVNQNGITGYYFSRISFIQDTVWVASDPAGFFKVNKACQLTGQVLLKGHSYIGTSWFARPGPSKDTLWLSTQTGMRWYHTATKTYGMLSFKGKPSSMDISPATDLFTDSKGLIWIGIGFGYGVVQYNPANRSMIHYPASGSNNCIPIRYPMTIAEDHEGNLWMGNHDGVGLARWRRKDNRFDMIRPDYYSTFDNASISALLCNRREQLWIATHNGLFRYHIPTQRIIKYDISDGLPSNALSSITEDDNGRLWIGTSNGLSCFYPNERKFVNFMHPNALPQPGINDVKFDSSTKKIFFTTAHFINAFDPDELLAQHTVLNIHLTGVQIGDEEKQIQAYYDLPYDQNDISFSFTAINFANGPLNKYYYKLDDEEWISLGNQRRVNFLNLRSGDYTFSLKAVNSAGIWSSAITTKFTINPPWWQTRLFQALVVLLLAGIISLVLARRIRHIRHVAEMRQKIAETEMMALRAQMNPHFIFNCINSIDALILSNDKYHATMYLNKFAKLLRNVLDSSKQNTVLLTKDLETLQLYIDLEQLRYENKFEAQIITDEALLQDDYKVPPLIIQPYVENAIIHGLKHRHDDKGRLTITISKQQDHIQYLIEDNGVGRHAQKNGIVKSASYGMQMSRDRVQFFNDEEHASVVVTDLQVEGKPAGTKVQVLLKIL